MSKPTDTGPGDRIRATLHAAYGRPLTDDEVQFINRQHEHLAVRLAEAEARAVKLHRAYLRARGVQDGDMPDGDSE
jgi:hypothetical protein